MGDVPRSTKALARDQFKQAQQFFRDRLGSGPADYTVFVAADHRAAKATYDALFNPERFPERFGITSVRGQCVSARAGLALLMILAYCGEGQSLADSLGEHHFDELLDRVAPSVWRTRGLPGSPAAGPHWLQVATRGYAAAAYRDAVGIETLDEARRAQAEIAARTAEQLRNFTALPEVWTLRDEAAEALSFLAGDWLVARAGEPALFEYYRLLESTGSWQGSFRAAFGITIEDFYQEFTDYRAAIGAAPPPDTPDGPTLVLLGEFDSWSADAVPARFEAVQAFFGDRLGGEPVDYTVYVAATPRAVAAHRAVIGARIPSGCWRLVRGE